MQVENITKEEFDNYIKFLKDSSKNQSIPFNERVVYKICYDKLNDLSTKQKGVTNDNQRT